MNLNILTQKQNNHEKFERQKNDLVLIFKLCPTGSLRKHEHLISLIHIIANSRTI